MKNGGKRRKGEKVNSKMQALVAKLTKAENSEQPKRESAGWWKPWHEQKNGRVIRTTDASFTPPYQRLPSPAEASIRQPSAQIYVSSFYTYYIFIKPTPELQKNFLPYFSGLHDSESSRTWKTSPLPDDYYGLRTNHFCFQLFATDVHKMLLFGLC